jgi:hypothetical protein
VPPPYAIAIVELTEQEGLRVATKFVDCEPDSVTIGMPVEVRFAEHAFESDTVFAPAFAPRLGQGRGSTLACSRRARGFGPSHLGAGAAPASSLRTARISAVVSRVANSAASTLARKRYWGSPNT